MGRLILKMSMSLDGFVGGPAGEVDWIFQSSDEASTAWILATLVEADVHVMGSRTFADMAVWWPTSSDVFAAPMNDRPKVVFSRTGKFSSTAALADAARARAARGEAAGVQSPSAVSWLEAQVARGELGAELADLKQRYGTMLAHGGARFAQSLVASGAVDEYRLLIHPVALGRGLPLFSTLPGRRNLRLMTTRPFLSGAVAHIYRPV